VQEFERLIDESDGVPGRQQALNWLLGRINYERAAVIPYQERQLKLDRMRQLLTRVGQPDAAMKIIHVAGTKGKGSTSAMIATMLTSAGYRTGVFSSPHLHRIEERFTVDGVPCTPTELVALVERLRPIVESMEAESTAEGDGPGGPTYFDITTAIAFLHFVEQQVDAAVIEVGLGGRLDSTNVCLPAISVITSISFDHMKQLGNTLAAIAREKAGIIKPGVPVVCGVTDAEPQSVIAEVAREHGCRLVQRGTDFDHEYVHGEKPSSVKARGDHQVTCNQARSRSPSASGSINFSYRVPGQELVLSDVSLGMRGAHQAANAAVALAVVAELRHQGWCISTEAMRLGLASATLPGRVEVVPGTPEVVLDAAHNPASARAFIAALGEMADATRRTLVLSVSQDKDVRAIVSELSGHFGRYIITQYQENPRAVDATQLAELVRQMEGNASAQVCVAPTPRDAWALVCRTAIQGERVCVTGSFYLAAEMRRLVVNSADVVTAGR
jgi:dihydrofolate synthase/folylpolyglutamate synthase